MKQDGTKKFLKKMPNEEQQKWLREHSPILDPKH